jgi:hypothetical protein
MPDQIQIALQESGLTVYAAARLTSGEVYNVDSGVPELIEEVNWEQVAMPLTEQVSAGGNATGDYYGDMLAPSTFTYLLEIFEQQGTAPVRKDDWLIASHPVYWDGVRLYYQGEFALIELATA